MRRRLACADVLRFACFTVRQARPVTPSKALEKKRLPTVFPSGTALIKMKQPSGFETEVGVWRGDRIARN